MTRATGALLAIGLLAAATHGQSSTSRAARHTTESRNLPPAEVDAELKHAEALTSAGKFDDARRLLENLSVRRPESTRSKVLLGRVHALEGDWKEVIEALSPIEAELDAEAAVLLAQAYAANDRATHGLNVLQRGLARHPDSETLWLALIDHTLELRQFSLALRRIARAERKLGPLPQLHYRAAQAYYHLGQVLGATRITHVPGGRAGQFSRGWLLVEERAGLDRFLCCPEASALYAVRRALDGGLDEPEVHCLHARIWQRAGRPRVGLAILQSREALWLENASAEMLATHAELALASEALGDFLRYSRLRAAREPLGGDAVLHAAFRLAAERYNQRGDEVMSRELLRRALALQPDNVEVMLDLADAVWEAGLREEAATWYRGVLEREPDHRDRLRILSRVGQ